MTKYRLIISQRGSDQSAGGFVREDDIWGASDEEAIRNAKMMQISFFLAGDLATLLDGLNRVVWRLSLEES